MVERGLVIFADSAHSGHISRYSSTLSESLSSAMLIALSRMSETAPLKEQYREVKELRPFIQYLAHAAARDTPASALANFEELIEQSLVNRQAADGAQSRKLRSIARAYLASLVGSSPLLSTADKSGLGSFSFSELYAKLRSDPIGGGVEQLVLHRGERPSEQNPRQISVASFQPHSSHSTPPPRDS